MKEKVKIIINSNERNFAMKTEGECTNSFLYYTIEMILRRLAERQLNILYSDLLTILMLADCTED